MNDVVYASPVLKSNKRVLNISPSTPIGLHRKHLFREFHQQLNSITVSEDIDMLDIREETEHNPLEHTSNYGRQDTPGDRRVVRGFRRIKIVGTNSTSLGEEGVGLSTGIGEHLLKRSKLDVNHFMEPTRGDKV